MADTVPAPTAASQHGRTSLIPLKLCLDEVIELPMEDGLLVEVDAILEETTVGDGDGDGLPLDVVESESPPESPLESPPM